MNTVEVSAEEVPLPACSSLAGDYCGKVLERLSLSNRELSVLFCGSRFIQKLNARYRGIDRPTDILSFPLQDGPQFPPEYGGPVPAGDIVISLDELRENAAAAGIAPDEELRRLLIHGILHLTGEDHGTNDNSEPMLIHQEALLKELPAWKMAV